MRFFFQIAGFLALMGPAAGAQGVPARPYSYPAPILASPTASISATPVATDLPPVRVVARSDFTPIGWSVLGAALALPIDHSVTRWSQQRSLQSNRPLYESAKAIAYIGDPGALVASVTLFAAGHLGRQPGLADAGLHATEAIIVSGTITHALKRLVGRARPNAVNDSNAFVFRVGRGSQAGFNAMPSGHTTASFAAAAVFSRELRASHPRVARFATPLLYGTAGLVGASRVYNDKHWTSDVIMGAAIGTMVGNRMVTYTHATPSSRWNWTLGLR